MIITVIDGMGGGLGKSIVELLRTIKTSKDLEIVAVGTNALATTNMMKAKPDAGATGENAIIYNANRADFVIASAGILLGNSMQGEITPTIASAVSCSEAFKIFVPIGRDDAIFLGTNEKPLNETLSQIIKIIKQWD